MDLVEKKKRMCPLTITAGSENLGAVKLDGQIGEVVLGVVKLAEVILGLKEALENGETSLAVSLSPFLALGIPHLERGETSTGHGKVRCIEDIASFIVNILRTVAEAEDLEDRELAAQMHGNQLSTALFVRSSNASKYGTPGLAWLVPCRDGLVVDRADGRVLLIEVEDARGRLLQKLAAAVA